MRNIFIFSVALIFTSCIVFSAFSQQQNTESITITTYYPAPYGVYKTLRLYPTSDTEIDINQPCTVKGELFMRDSDSSLYLCSGSKWQSVSKPTLECITGIYRGGKNGFITKDMLKPLYSKSADRIALFNDLIANGYIDAGGVIQDKFRSLADYSGLALDAKFMPKQEEIYVLISAHLDVETAGSGIVSPTSHVTPFIGSSTLEDTSYNYADVFTTEDIYETNEAGDSWAPIIRCRADNGWIATGCGANTWGGSGNDEDEYLLHNGCKGQQWGDNRISVRCCRVVNTGSESFTFYGDSRTSTTGKGIIY
ncbi:MAG: hypothetical protein Q8O30_04370 [Candidatus Omnitrophota bacterium]|nr:hypothetical protein [Candidatus Omnitrophota bacterium]